MLLRATVASMRYLLIVFFILLSTATSQAQEMTEKFADEPVFNAKVRLLEDGSKSAPTLILVHGVGPEGAEIWREFIPELARDYHVVACDLPGFGQSEKANQLYSPENYTAFIGWLVENYADDGFILAGHSLGAALSLHYAATAPVKPDKLILIDAAGILHRAALTKFLLQLKISEANQYVPSSSLDWLDRVVGAAIEKLQNVPVDVDLILQSELLRQQVLQGDPARIAGLALIQTDFTSLLSKVTSPTFLLWGEDDEIAPLRTGQLLAARLPQAQLELIADGGHTPMRRQPSAFRQLFYRALQAKPLQLPPEKAPISDRVGHCVSQDGMSFSGSYLRIELNHCRNAHLIDVTTAKLVLVDSAAIIERSRIVGNDVGLDAVRSQVIATALDVEAELPIRSEQSSFDFAGILLRSRSERLVEGVGNPSRLLFSVSRGETPTRNLLLHQVLPVLSTQPL